jgi:hypothetical protein
MVDSVAAGRTPAAGVIVVLGQAVVERGDEAGGTRFKLA